MASGNPLKRVIIAGGSGFLGQSLASALSAHVEEIVVLTRGPSRQSGRLRHVNWDARTVGPWVPELNDADALVNLVGRTVDCRKTPANKKVILQSRVDSVKALAAAWQQCERPPGTWIQAATAHIYGDTADEVLDESSPIGSGFAPEVGLAWEATLNHADLPGCRRVVLRISFVLGRNGGPLTVLSRLARLGLGGTVGSGRQYMSWLHQDDLNRIILRALTDPSMHGIYVASAPHPVTNSQFMAELRRAVRRPWSPPVPGPMVRLGAWLMRTDPDLALLGRRVLPTRLMNERFEFRFATLPGALKDLL
jgi:uncharacterized protein (TIGR01777 family)